jgi:hypothetical protein
MQDLNSSHTARFAAPWSRLLKMVSLLGSIVVLGVTFTVTVTAPDSQAWIRWIALPFGLLMLGMCALFTVRGYELSAGCLLIRRLLWSTRLSLEGLKDAYADQEAMCRSIRLFGNGGLFSFTGWFWNKRLGSYRAMATDPARAVVLVFPGKTIVVTPDRPAALVGALPAGLSQGTRG